MIEVLKKKVVDSLEADNEGLTKIDWQGLAQLRRDVSSWGKQSVDLYKGLFDEVLDAIIGSRLGSCISEGNFALVGNRRLLIQNFLIHILLLCILQESKMQKNMQKHFMAEKGLLLNYLEE